MKVLKKAFFAFLLCVLTCGFSLFGCVARTEDITVYIPDGAPSLAFAKMMQEDTQTDGVCYRVVSANVIATKVTNDDDDKNADLCVLPVTAASKLLGSGEKYRMIGTVTNGNLYILSNDETVYTKDNLSALIGKTVGVLQINQVPGLTFKAVLNRNGIAWQEWRSDVEKADDKVNLKGITDANSIGMDGADCYVIAEPAVSAQVAKKGLHIVGDLQELYATENGETGYPQAVLVAKNETLSQKMEWVKEFLLQLKQSIASLTEMSAADVYSAVTSHIEDKGYQTTLKQPFLTAEVFARCRIGLTQAKDCSLRVDEFLAEMVAVNPQATRLADQAFYDKTDFLG